MEYKYQLKNNLKKSNQDSDSDSEYYKSYLDTLIKSNIGGATINPKYIYNIQKLLNKSHKKSTD